MRLLEHYPRRFDNADDAAENRRREYLAKWDAIDRRIALTDRRLDREAASRELEAAMVRFDLAFAGMILAIIIFFLAIM